MVCRCVPHLEMGCEGEVSKRGWCTEDFLLSKRSIDQTFALEINPKYCLLMCGFVAVVEQTQSSQTGFFNR